MIVLVDISYRGRPKLHYRITVIILISRSILMVYGGNTPISTRLLFLLVFQDNPIHRIILGIYWKQLLMERGSLFTLYGNRTMPMMPGIRMVTPILLVSSLMPKRTLAAGSRTVWPGSSPLTRSPMPINGPWMMITRSSSSAPLVRPTRTAHLPG